MRTFGNASAIATLKRSRGIHSAAAAVAVASAALFLAAAPASAALSHAFTTTFGAATSSPPDSSYPISEPTDVEVDQASDDIYVTDPGNHRIEKFNEKGEFLLMFGKEVNATSGGNVCDAGETCQSGSAGESAGAFETPSYLAVDNTCAWHEPPLTGAACEALDPSSGDIYVADTGDSLVSKFNSSGQSIASWGAGGQKNGSDADFGPFDHTGPIFGVAVGGPGGNLYVGGNAYVNNNFWEYSQSGAPIGPYHNSGAPWLKVDPDGNVYSGAPYAFDLPASELYKDTGEEIDHYSSLSESELLDSFGSGDLNGAGGMAVDGASHTVYVANTSENTIAVFDDARPIVTTGLPVNATESEITLTGHIEPAGRGNITSCYFEYGFEKSYGNTVPCTPDPSGHPFEGATDVTATLSGFSPGTQDHYRLVATNAAGATGASLDKTFSTTQAPAIDGLVSANLTATSADLSAQVNPNGLDTTYRFEYGPTTSYGQSAPVPDGLISASNSDQTVGVHLDNLVPHTVYHYTLVATNEDGTTTAEDHTFNFFPPSCPNENVRQQTQANYLPDCRAYELVSPESAGGTLLFPGGPNTGEADSPARFSFTGLYSTIPNSGGSPIDGFGDLYVSTRTDTGWVTKYVGLPSNEVAVDGGPPMGPPLGAGVVGSGLTGRFESEYGYANESNAYLSEPARIQNNVLTDPAMDTFVDWDDGDVNSTGGSNAPYVWSANGSFLDRWPTNLSTAPGGHYLAEEGKAPVPTAGGVHALDCLNVLQTGYSASNFCPGDVSASSDLSHFVFATEWSTFAPEGQVTPPGSVYDNNTATRAVEIASKLAGGAPIPSEPTDEAGDTLQIPAVSSDGSHILMAAGATGPCGSAQCPEVTHCDSTFRGVIARCQLQASHLYMRVDDAVTYDISQGHDVTYVGMTPDGSKVFFTSEEQLTTEDKDTSTDLYMWSENGEEEHHPLTLLSKGDDNGNAGEPGQSDNCTESFSAKCGVVTYADASYCTLAGGAGGNCRSDNSIASESGDIYFFSPEQLDGSHGLKNQENLYDYRNGAAQYVATFTTGPFCYQSPVPDLSDSACSDTPIVRIQVSPNDSHMAFVTASPITQYDNAGHLEMYTYEPSTRKIVCVSCIPSGAPPTSDVEASQDGLFMTNDGRTFFSTEEALVHGDTNQGEDIYEYVDGRPQLVTPGTGDTGAQGAAVTVQDAPGLIGVSANGTDVYFSTLDTLVPQDHNGLTLKFYDARSGGGFSSPPSSPTCDAADECHGTGSEPPEALENGTGAALGGGGDVVAPQISTKRHKKHHKRSHKSHGSRSAGARRKGAK